MERYKNISDIDFGVHTSRMVKNSRGEWVKYQDVAEALNVVGELSKLDNVDYFAWENFKPLTTRAKIFMEGM